MPSKTPSTSNHPPRSVKSSVPRFKHWGQVFFGSLLTVCILLAFFFQFPTEPSWITPEYGVTFSPAYAESLGLDWHQTYDAIVGDLGVKRLRLSTYWDVTEPHKGEFDFHDVDYELNGAGVHGAKVLFAVGRKLPRWPECHDPEWIQGATQDRTEQELLSYVDTVVQRYKDNPVIDKWQVENELYFPFGICPHRLGGKTLDKEIAIIKKYSDKPVVVTDSGEWSTWFPAVLHGDILGISTYREAWNPILGHIPFPLTPGYYQIRASLIAPVKTEIIITEVQAEPWGPRPVSEMSQYEMYQYMPLAKVLDNVHYAQQIGFPEVYLWGVEWWYWLKVHGDESYWNELKKVF